MLNGWRRPLFSLAAGFLLVLPLAGRAWASYNIANYNVAASCAVVPNLHYVFDGVDKTPSGGMLGNGNPLGFLCDGNTYVPLRWLAQELGHAVEWNGNTHTIFASSSGASQHGARFHIVKVHTGASGTTVAVQVDNSTHHTSYVYFTVNFEDGFGHVLGSIQGPQTGRDFYGKTEAEIGPGQTQTMTVTSSEDFSGYVSIAIAPWAAACPIACPPLNG